MTRILVALAAIVAALTVGTTTAEARTACDTSAFLGRASTALGYEGRAYDAAGVNAFASASRWTLKAKTTTAWAPMPCRSTLRRYRSLKLSQYAVLMAAWRAYARGDTETGNDLLENATAIQEEASYWIQ